MASNKVLPPTPPLDASAKSPNSALPVYSTETYARLLEQENEQLRLKNHQLQTQISCLETKVDAYNLRKQTHKELAERYNSALDRRDELVSEIAETIIGEFQRYKQSVQKQAQNSEEIMIYNGIGDSSPI